MKVGYLASLYPALSHTFIQREILELEKLGVDVVRFSVRRALPKDQLGDVACLEATKTRSLLPLGPDVLVAMLWLVLTRPLLGVKTFRLALRSARGLHSIVKWCAYFVEAILLAYWLQKDGVKHLHCHFGNAGSNTAWLAAKLALADLSITFHGIDLDEPELFRHREKLADAIFAICISNFGRQLLLQSIDTENAPKVVVVRCGFPVPPAHIVPPPPKRGEIICVARLSEEKGHHVLLEALSLLIASDVNFHCTLVGSGPLEGDLTEAISRLGLAQHVTMSGGVPNDKVVAMIAASDLSVLASYGEGIPIALLESLAWERPYVATRVGGIPELTPKDKSGLLVEPGNAQELADGLKRLIEDTELSSKLAKSGRAIVTEFYDPGSAATSMLELFRKANRMHSTD